MCILVGVWRKTQIFHFSLQTFRSCHENRSRPQRGSQKRTVHKTGGARGRLPNSEFRDVGDYQICFYQFSEKKVISEHGDN